MFECDLSPEANYGVFHCVFILKPFILRIVSQGCSVRMSFLPKSQPDADGPGRQNMTQPTVYVSVAEGEREAIHNTLAKIP